MEDVNWELLSSASRHIWSSNAITKKQVENKRKYFSLGKGRWVELLATPVNIKINSPHVVFLF